MTIRRSIVACLMVIHVLPATAKEGLSAPDAWVRDLYEDYGKANRPDPLGAAAPDLFAPTLLRLIRADEHVPPGEVGRLDEDPLCACQDDDGFRLFSIETVHLSSARARTTVHISIVHVPIVVVLDLVRNDDGWRIADVHSKDIPSLVSYLENPAPPH